MWNIRNCDWGFTASYLNFLVQLGYQREFSCFLQFWNFFRSLSLHPSMKFSSTFSPLRNSFDPIVCCRSPDSSKMKIARIVKAISISSTPSILNFISTGINSTTKTITNRNRQYCQKPIAPPKRHHQLIKIWPIFSAWELLPLGPLKYPVQFETFPWFFL